MKLIGKFSKHIAEYYNCEISIVNGELNILKILHYNGNCNTRRITFKDIIPHNKSNYTFNIVPKRTALTPKGSNVKIMFFNTKFESVEIYLKLNIYERMFIKFNNYIRNLNLFIQKYKFKKSNQSEYYPNIHYKVNNYGSVEFSTIIKVEKNEIYYDVPVRISYGKEYANTEDVLYLFLSQTKRIYNAKDVRFKNAVKSISQERERYSINKYSLKENIDYQLLEKS